MATMRLISIRPPHDPGDAADLNIMGYSNLFSVAAAKYDSPKTLHVELIFVPKL